MAKLNSKRLYKLAHVVMWVIAIPLLLIGVNNFIRYDRYANQAYTETRECLNKYQDVQIDGLCDFWYSDLEKIRSLMWIGLVVGIGLPTAFYIVKVLTKYLTTEDKHNG